MGRWNAWFAAAVAGLLACLVGGGARAQISDEVVRVGVLNDISGVFQDTNGPGSVMAARMAAEDFAGGGRGIRVEIVQGDHQNRADVGSALVRRWLDVDKVDAVVDVPNSAVGLAINTLAPRQPGDAARLLHRHLGPHRQPVLAEHRAMGDGHLGHRQLHRRRRDGARRR